MTDVLIEGGDVPLGLEDDLAAHMAAKLLDSPRPGSDMPPRSDSQSGPTAPRINMVPASTQVTVEAPAPTRLHRDAVPSVIRTSPPVPVPQIKEQPSTHPASDLMVTLEQPAALKAPRAKLRWIEAILVGLIVLVGGALRVINLDAVGLNSDEAVYAGQGGALLEVGSLPDHFSIFRAHPLLLQFVMGIVFRIGGQSDIAARLTVAVAFGLGSVIVSYFLARELYGRWVGLASAVLLATMPYHVVVSRQVLVDTPMAFFALLGIYLAARAARRNSRRDLYLAFAACALAAISKEIAVLLIPVLVAWLRLGPARIPLIRFVGPSFVFAAIGLPFPLTRLVNQPSNASQFFLWQFARSPNHDADYFLNILFQFAGVGFVVALIVGIAGLVLCRSGADQLLLWWLVTFGLFFQFWPTKLFPYLFLILPAMVIAAVASLDRLGRYVLSARWQHLGQGAAVLALTMSFAAGSSGIVLAGPAAELEGFGDFDIEVQTFAGSREFGQWAGENTPDNSRFLTIGPSLGNILRFYGARDSVALSVSTNPERRNPAYVPIENPDLAMRQMSVHYVVWDAYSADRSAFYNNRLRGYARKLGGEIVFSAWAEGDQLRTEPGPPPDDAEVRIVVWDIPGAGSTTGGRREAGLS